MESDPDNFIEVDFKAVLSRVVREDQVLSLWHTFFSRSLQICSSASNSLSSLVKDLNFPSNSTSNAQIALQNATSEFKELQTAIANVEASMARSVVSPMEHFLERYRNRIAAVQDEGNLIIESISKMHKGAENLKEKYWNLHETFNKSLREESITIERIHALDRELTETKKQYAEFIPYANKGIFSKYLAYKSAISSIYEIEGSKIQLLKDLLKEQIAGLKSLGNTLLDKALSLSGILSFFNAETEVEMIEGECAANSFLFTPVRFLDYNSDPSKQLVYDNYFISTDNMSNESITVVFKKTIDNLKDNKDMTLDEKAYIVEFLHHSHTRKLFAEILRDINEPVWITSESSFKAMGDLINYMMARFVLEGDDDYTILSCVLSAAKNVFLKVWLVRNVTS
eukprot:TRINITY_DN2379_c0_g3_i2.p1 TRINITY_DN2379_c0_g3~~TRINITY_DN2379_c0_g3_i2.p1  ORF type:complete len:398 (+),score=69.04 TRINITY_DN2379_c0_g3_i2:157-1350(+)